MMAVALLFLVASVYAQPPTVVPAGGRKIVELSKAISYLAKYHHNPLNKARSQQLARWFWKYGNRWAVDPWMAVSIACQESIFKDRPRKIFVNRCKTVIDGDRAIQICRKVWGGEYGMMQVVPTYAKPSFRACKGRKWKTTRELHDTETNLCVSIHLMAARRGRIRKRIRRRIPFMLRGAKGNWTRRYSPCSRRHRKFCKNGNKAYCKRWWWVASWNWGSHRVICNRVSKQHDFAGYPIRVIGRYRKIVERFKKT